jgi:hypothetical protein
MKRSAGFFLLFEAPTTAMTSTPPGLRTAGAVAVQVLTDAQLTPLAKALPNRNAVVETPGAKPEPLIVTAVPPAFGPLDGLTLLTLGRPNLKLSAGEPALVPPGPLTVTSTVPLAPGGETAVIDDVEFTV